MKSFIVEHQEKHASFQGWMDSAKEKIQSAAGIVGDLEELQQHAEALEVGDRGFCLIVGGD